MLKQRGVALITAVLVIALAAIVAAAMLSSTNLSIHRASTLSDTERAWWYADGIETWVKSLLMLDQQNSKIDYLGEEWAKGERVLPVDEGNLQGGVTDLQGRFNLNNLGLGANEQDPVFLKYKAQFQRLVQSIDAVKQAPTDGLAEAIHDWIDQDDQPMGFGGAEDSEYTTLTPPYRAANHIMTSVTELLAIKGVTKEIYLGLRDYVCVLPEQGTKININTAPLPVLMSLSASGNSSLAQFAQDRIEKPIEDGGETAFWNDHFAAANPASDVGPTGITTHTEYFLLHGEAFIGSSHLALYSVVHRPPKQNGALPAVISRSQDI